MLKHYLFISVLILFNFVLIMTAFLNFGSPLYQKGIKMDFQKETDIQNIQADMEAYYQNNGYIANSLSDLPNKYIDPSTGGSYDYKVKDSMDFSICTNFYKAAVQDLSSTNVNPVPFSHKKGFDCIPYTITSVYGNIQPDYPSPTPYNYPYYSPSPTPQASSTATPYPSYQPYGTPGAVYPLPPVR